MRVRIFGLGLLAVVILGGGLYLFLQVTSDPATPAVAARDDRPSPRDQPATNDHTSETAPRFTPMKPRTGSATIDRPIRPTTDTSGTGATTGTGPALEGSSDEPTGTDPDVDLDLAMDEANKLYDGNDYEAATKQAQRVLAKHPENVRMMRIVVSSGCLMGDLDTANKYQAMLPARDQADMIRRCGAANVHLDPVKGGGAAGTGIRKP